MTLLNADGTPIKETVGAASLKAREKEQEDTDYIELQRSIHKGENSERSYEEEVLETVRLGMNQYDSSFYVVVLFRKERHLTNVVRQQFHHRISCPTPQYDQTVYYYDKAADKVEFLWVVPNVATCQYLPLMPLDVQADQRELVKFVMDFKSGKLDDICARRNNEVFVK